MVDDEVVETHSGPSSWILNLVIKPKNNGGIRPALDMRNCNLVIKKGEYTRTQTERGKINVSWISGV